MRRTAVISASFLLVLAAFSLVLNIVQNSNTAAQIQAVEWLKDNGLNGFVLKIETWWYTLTAPSKGGPTIKHLPRLAGRTISSSHSSSTKSGSAAHHVLIHYEPPRIQPLIKPALPGEGVWQAPFASFHGPPPVLITTYRSDPAYPQTVAGVAWIDHTETSVMLYPGAQEPSVNLPNRGPEEIPPSLRYKLVAAFNSGFKLVDSHGGYARNGVTYAPMRNGDGTAVRYTNGKVNVIDWQYGPKAPSNIVYARQNLPLIVDNGKPNPTLNGGPQWGATLGNAVQVWRSALGIDKYGNLIYAAANYQTANSLAAIMIHVGAVRAMELDINAYWPSFISYTGPNAAGAAQLLPGMAQGAQRYLTPDNRDFFAVYLNH